MFEVFSLRLQGTGARAHMLDKHMSFSKHFIFLKNMFFLLNNVWDCLRTHTHIYNIHIYMFRNSTCASAVDSSAKSWFHMVSC